MIIEGGLDALNRLVKQQLINLFSCTEEEAKQVSDAMDHTLVRLEQNFEKNPNKYYKREGETYFNPFHSGQYCIFLYYLSNTIFRVMQKRVLIADKIYYLNKALNACDLYYEIDLPDYFTTDHPVGTVLGRATYGNGFSFGQNCTIGNNKGIFPILGENVRLCAMSAIIGNCTIGDNVTLGAGGLVKDEDVPSNTIVFGSSPNLVLKSNV